jgi:hypothetical protein
MNDITSGERSSLPQGMGAAAPSSGTGSSARSAADTPRSAAGLLRTPRTKATAHKSPRPPNT